MSQDANRSVFKKFYDQHEGLLRSLRRGWARLTDEKLAVIGLAIIIGMIGMALFAPFISPHTLDWTAPSKQVRAEDCETLDCLAAEDTGQINHPAPPKFGELTGDIYFAPLGTDDQGADVLSRVIWGSRTALYIGILAGIISSLVGVPLGLISGFYGDTWIDESIQRLVDIMYGLPFLPLVIVLVALRGITTTNVILAISVKAWVNNAMIIRAQTLSLKERSYIEAAEVAGASDTRIVFRHIMPNVLPLAFLYLAQDAAAAVILQANLAFLGLADFTNVSWGAMLNWIQVTGNVYTAPWWLIPPGLMIVLLAGSFFFIGYSFEGVLNPQ